MFFLYTSLNSLLPICSFVFFLSGIFGCVGRYSEMYKRIGQKIRNIFFFKFLDSYDTISKILVMKETDWNGMIKQRKIPGKPFKQMPG